MPGHTVDGLYFSGEPQAIRSHSRGQVEKEQQSRASRAAEAKAWADVLARVRQRRFEPEDRRYLAEVELMAYGRREKSRVLAELGRAQTPESAHGLLLELGVWDQTVDPYPRRLELPEQSPQLPLAELAAEARRDLTHLPAFAIDDQGTADPDDAVSIDGDRLWVHVADVAALAALSIGGTQVEELRKTLVGRIGENMSIRRFQRLQAKGRLSSYVHGGSKIGVVVDLVGGDDSLAKDIAMHIAASKPVVLDQNEVSAELIEREREIARQKAAESGKPANIVEKMVEGSVQKYLKEVTLLGQPFVKDDKQTVGQLLKSKGAQVDRFVLYVVGEGIEKKSTDFAAEVMAQAAAAR